MRYSSDAIAVENLRGSFPVVRWRDHWGTWWEHKQGWVWQIKEGQEWTP
jgi:hypothetical protein